VLRVERLPADVLDPGPVALAVQAGRLALPGLVLPRAPLEVPIPEERFDPDQRAELSAALERALARRAPPVAVLDSVRALARPGTLAVVTGQQPGFLCSPLLALYKALHAVRVARSLTQAFERPVVPIFWNHGDDHDVAEVHHSYLLNENLDLKKVALAGLSSGRKPLEALVLSEQQQRLAAIGQLLGQMLERAPHAAPALELCLPRDGETLVSAFTRVWLDWLGRFGLVVLEPAWIRTELSRALARLVACEPAARLAEGSAALAALGLEPTIEPAGAALVYRVDAHGRRALRAGGDGFRYDGEDGSRRGSELAAEIVAEPDRWSAGALLRPLVQDLCLPVAAYVGGWSELGYQAELLPLRRAAGVPLTPLVPRVSCTLVEPEVQASLARLETDVESVLRAKGAPPAEPGPEAPVAADLRRAGEQAAALLLAHKPALGELDKGLAANLARAAGQVRDLAQGLAEKAARVQQNNAGTGRRHERRVSNSLMPRGAPQERVLGPLPFVARHGTAWLGELLDQIAPYDMRHMVVTFEEPA
jgi:bacillithiol biosynthesis cysteine-adding enzyme BshC